MRRAWVAGLVAVALAATSWAQVKKREALSDAEIDELRETKLEPNKRLKNYVKFAQARMATMEQMRSDPRFAGERAQQVHRLLEDFFSIVEELDRNIDMYADENMDIRKSLKEVVEAGSAFQLKLRALKQTEAQGGSAEEQRGYAFVLEDTQEALNGMLQNARETLDEQIALDKEKKLFKSYEDKEEKQRRGTERPPNPSTP